MRNWKPVEITNEKLKKLAEDNKGKSLDEIMTTIKLERETYIEVKKKLLEERMSFKEWINNKMKEEIKKNEPENTKSDNA